MNFTKWQVYYMIMYNCWLHHLSTMLSQFLVFNGTPPYIDITYLQNKYIVLKNVIQQRYIHMLENKSLPNTIFISVNQEPTIYGFSFKGGSMTYIREHVIKSTCDENVNQLTLGVGGFEALQHYHRTKSTEGFIYV